MLMRIGFFAHAQYLSVDHKGILTLFKLKETYDKGQYHMFQNALR